MNLFDIVDSNNLFLENNVKKYNDSLIDNFMNTLKNHLTLFEAMEKLNKVPKDTLFSLDRYEGDYAICENRTTGEMFDIPRLKITPYAKEGDILKLENNTYTIDLDETRKVTNPNDSKNNDFGYRNLPRDTIFYVDYIEDGFASCIDTTKKYSEKYEIPISLLDNSVKGGTYIQFNKNKYVNVSKPEGYNLYD